MSDAPEAELRVQRDKLKARIGDAHEAVEGLDGQIERLEEAKRRVEPIPERVSLVRRGVEHLDPDRWEGANRHRFNDVLVSEVVKELRTYAHGAVELYRHIGERIRRLEQERAHNVDAVRRLTSALSTIDHQLDKTPK